MGRSPFPGYPKFLESAALGIGRPAAEIPARRDPTLAAVANLCAQASLSGPVEARAILEKAEGFRDQLRAAAAAADLMIDEVGRSVGIEPAPTVAEARTPQARRPASPGGDRRSPSGSATTP